jgi:hypothetical protein
VIHAYGGVVPKVHPSAWIAESADRSAKIYISLAADHLAASAE